MMASTPQGGDRPDDLPGTDADEVARPEQPPMDDDASGLPDKDADELGDFA